MGLQSPFEVFGAQSLQSLVRTSRVAGGGGGVRLKPGLFGSWHSGFLLPN